MNTNMIAYEKQAERWGMVEVVCYEPSEGNPFTELYVKGGFWEK